MTALLANIPTQAEFLLHSLEQASGGISLHVNADKTYMYFNQEGVISILNYNSLKLVDRFMYLGSSFSSTQCDINTRLAKAWAAIDRLSITWKSNLFIRIKWNFFHALVVLILLYECTRWTLTKRIKKKLDRNYKRILRAIVGNSGCDIQRYNGFTATYLPSLKPLK